MSLRDRLNKLESTKRRQLQYAFDQQFTQYVEAEPGFFVGVNVQPIKHLTILESVGVWSYGKINGTGGTGNG